MSVFDALAMDVTTAVAVQIVHPKTRQPLRDESGKEAFVEIVSPESPEVQKVQKKAIDKRLKARGRATMTADELEAERAETLIAATKNWFLVSLDGKVIDVPFTPENARLLYTNPGLAWVREQVSEAFDERATFL